MHEVEIEAGVKESLEPIDEIVVFDGDLGSGVVVGHICRILSFACNISCEWPIDSPIICNNN